MRQHRQSPWSNTFFSFVVPCLIGSGAVLLTSVLFSMLTLFVLGTMQFLPIFSIISLTVGGYISGRMCGRYRRHRGLIDGAICGIILEISASTVSIFILGSLPDIKKLLLLICAGAVGGVVGINSKRPENLM